MRLRYKILLFVLGVLGCTALFQRCNRPKNVKGPAQITYKDGGDVIVIKQPGRKDTKIYQPDPGSTVITTDKHGNVNVKVRQFGVGFQPGLGIGISDRPRVALDARIVYFKRASLHTGLGISLDTQDYQNSRVVDIVDPYLGLGYVPTLALPNTALVASYTMTRHAFVFVRLRF